MPLKPATFNAATHLSIIWGVCLAIMTVLEWNSLERNPVNQEILSPFIERTMQVTVAKSPESELPDPGEQEESADAVLHYAVEINFNGPLFLACFFIPVLIFHGAGMLWRRLRAGPGPPG